MGEQIAMDYRTYQGNTMSAALAVVKQEQLRPFLIASIVVSVVFWYISEAFGMILTSYLLERHRVDGALGEAPRAEGAEPALAPVIEQDLREDAARGVAGAEEEDVVVRHGIP